MTTNTESKIKTLAANANLRTLPGGFSYTDTGVGGVKGLAFDVSPDGLTRSWFLRYVPAHIGKRVRARTGGLDAFPTLADARKDARLRLGIVDVLGVDPRLGPYATGKAIKFLALVEEHKLSFCVERKNTDDAVAEWDRMIRECEKLHHLDMHVPDTETILGVLKPIWLTHPIKATMIREKLERLFDVAAALGYRKRGSNPAVWRGNLKPLLPAAKKLNRKLQKGKGRGEGRRPVPVSAMAQFVANLRAEGSRVAQCLEWLVLTAARNQEARGARWEQINWEKRIWDCPPELMKKGRRHIVPLTDAMIALLEKIGVKKTGLIFPTDAPRRDGKPRTVEAQFDAKSLLKCLRRNYTDAPADVHGLRTSFRTWVGDDEVNNWRGEVAEFCLAHVNGDAAQQAYDKAEMVGRRRTMLNAWAAFCGPQAAPVAPTNDNVVSFAARVA